MNEVILLKLFMTVRTCSGLFYLSNTSWLFHNWSEVIPNKVILKEVIWTEVVCDFFTTCSKVFHDLFTTFFQLIHDLFMSCSQLSHKFSQLIHHYFCTCLSLIHNFFISFSHLVHELFRTCSGLFYSSDISWWLFHNWSEVIPNKVILNEVI